MAKQLYFYYSSSTRYKIIIILQINENHLYIHVNLWCCDQNIHGHIAYLCSICQSPKLKSCVIVGSRDIVGSGGIVRSVDVFGSLHIVGHYPTVAHSKTSLKIASRLQVKRKII